jgi:hypothetical protein
MAETPQELFEHDVQDPYDAEQKLVRARSRRLQIEMGTLVCFAGHPVLRHQNEYREKNCFERHEQRQEGKRGKDRTPARLAMNPVLTMIHVTNNAR